MGEKFNKWRYSSNKMLSVMLKDFEIQHKIIALIELFMVKIYL